MARTWAGSICHLQGVPYDDVLTMPAIDLATRSILNNITLKPGKTWNIIKLLSQSGALAESNTFEASGILWTQTITGKLFGQSEYNHVQAENWTNYKWLLLCREVGSGISYLVGNAFRGASVTVSYDNSATTLTSLQFDFKSKRRAVIYQGTLIVPPAPASPVGSSGFAQKPIEFLVGDAGTIADQGDSYTNTNLIGKNIMVFVDGKIIPVTSFFNVQSAQFNILTGTISFLNKLNQGQLIQIFY